MAIDRSYVTHNDTQRKRLRALVERLSDADLSHPMAAGWTVAAVLAHLAFWDQHALVLLDSWERSGRPPKTYDEDAVDWINDAGKPLCLALAPREAARLAVRIADAIDRKVAGLSDEMVAANTRAGGPVKLLRAEHRHEHLDEIERVLGK